MDAASRSEGAANHRELSRHRVKTVEQTSVIATRISHEVERLKTARQLRRHSIRPRNSLTGTRGYVVKRRDSEVSQPIARRCNNILSVVILEHTACRLELSRSGVGVFHVLRIPVSEEPCRIVSAEIGGGEVPNDWIQQCFQ